MNAGDRSRKNGVITWANRHSGVFWTGTQLAEFDPTYLSMNNEPQVNEPVQVAAHLSHRITAIAACRSASNRPALVGVARAERSALPEEHLAEAHSVHRDAAMFEVYDYCRSRIGPGLQAQDRIQMQSKPLSFRIGQGRRDSRSN